MLKSYEEMRKIDVTPYCEKRDGYTYLNWAMCMDLLHTNGAKKVYWLPIPSPETGNSLRMTTQQFSDSKGNVNRCYETRIKVVIDENEYEMHTPVMNGSNPVKDNSMSQQRVWNSMCRAFVKCVAIHTGLGFDLWLKEEYDKRLVDIPETGDEKASNAKINTLKAECTSNGVNLSKWLKNYNMTLENLTENAAAQMLVALKKKYGGE